jgi:WhiB family redox-sensing transcriptional regulator
VTVLEVGNRAVVRSILWTDLLNWMCEGLCQQNSEIKQNFLIESKSREEMAKRICHGCPVRYQCLRWSLENPEDSGVWGGLSSRERRAVAAIAHDGSWRDSVARKPWCPWCRSRKIFSPHQRRLQCQECSFNWPGLMPYEGAKITGQ